MNCEQCFYYRLKEPILDLLWGLVDMFFGHNFPKPEQLTDHGAHSHKKNGGNRPRGSASGCQNVFCFFLLSRQRGLSATYPAPILTILEKQT